MDNLVSTYLIDTSSLITPFKRYYPFDLAPPFWKSMEAKIKDGSIVLLDKVYDEVTAGDDELTEWLSGIENTNIVSHKDTDIVKKCGEILSYIQACGFYKPKALAEWADAKVAGFPDSHHFCLAYSIISQSMSVSSGLVSYSMFSSSGVCLPSI